MGTGVAIIVFPIAVMALALCTIYLLVVIHIYTDVYAAHVLTLLAHIMVMQ